MSSPIVWGDRVIVTTAISSDPKPFRHGLYGDVEPSNDVAKHTWKVYALDRKTGKVIWEQIATEGAPKTKRHTKSSQATCTPGHRRQTRRGVVRLRGPVRLRLQDRQAGLEAKTSA